MQDVLSDPSLPEVGCESLAEIPSSKNVDVSVDRNCHRNGFKGFPNEKVPGSEHLRSVFWTRVQWHEWSAV